MTIIEKVNDCDVIIDFSLADASPMAEIAAKSGKPMVIGTTGHDKDLKQKIIDILGPIVVWAGNFSTGVNLLFFLTQQVRVLDTSSDLI